MQTNRLDCEREREPGELARRAAGEIRAEICAIRPQGVALCRGALSQDDGEKCLRVRGVAH
jgi:hypothetical protein